MASALSFPRFSLSTVGLGYQPFRLPADLVSRILALTPTSQQTQVFSSSLTPIIRQSFGDLVEVDLRSNLGVVSSSNGGLFGNPTPTSSTTSVANVQQDQTTLTVAIGRGEGVAASRLTLDAAEINSQSVAQSTQLRGYVDAQYRFNPEFAAVGRFGYEDVRYPRAGLAFNEPTFLAGGQMTFGPGTSAVLQFGRQDGSYGFSGTLRAQITPTIALLASQQRSLGSSSESILSNLNDSSLDPYGTTVNTYTLLPSAIDPEFAYATTDIYRYQESRIALEEDAGRTDSFRLFAFLDHQTSLTGATSSDTGKGVSFSWFRSMTPNLTSVVAIGYATHVAGGGTKTATVDLGLNYTFTETLTGAIHYDLIDARSEISANTFLTNVLEVTLRKSF